jgi:methionyl-tRNA formyltransferase
MKIIFMGTPDFGIPSLNALIQNGHSISCVVTQVDKPNERGNRIEFCPVKKWAIERKIPVYQFEKIRETGAETLKDVDADIIITAAYGQIISEDVIKLKKYGIVNIHGSLLPKYRGASPIQQSIINGDKETGITILQTGIGMDDGDIILQKKLEILPNETSGELYKRMSVLGSECIVEALKQIESGKVNYVKQDNSLATICKKLKKENSKIDFNNDANTLVNFINGFSPSPATYFEYNGKKFKCYKAMLSDEKDDCAGKILTAKSKMGLVISAKNGSVSILNIQAEGGKVLDIKDFLNGNKFIVGDIIK